MSNPELFDLATRWAKAERPHLLQMGEEMRHDLAAFAEHAITSLKSLEGPRLTVDEAMDGLRKWMYENKWRLCGMHSYEHPFTTDQFTSIREALTKSANP